MADIRIKVTTDELRQAISKFNTCKDEMAQAYAQMSTEAMTLNSSWDGEASQAFMEQFSELITNIRTSDATIEQAVKGLEAAAGFFEAAEEDISSMGEGMTEAPAFNG
ncbi:MAG: WXG100 family type VII secretion target [Clostridia bacterium]|nr:WXG100 family type VII secretion target [Clostridia bacterium]